eukprot:gene9473-10461_t
MASNNESKVTFSSLKAKDSDLDKVNIIEEDGRDASPSAFIWPNPKPHDEKATNGNKLRTRSDLVDPSTVQSNPLNDTQMEMTAKPKRRRTRTTSVNYSSFSKKTCTYFHTEDKDSPKYVENVCCCGRKEDEHSDHALQKRTLNDPWDKNKHTKRSATNAYGEVEFHGCARKTRAKYIRLADDSNAEQALKLLLKEWKLEYPKLLISVTGGAKSFNLPKKLKQQFREGLLKVAQSTGAWVITGGTNTGVMKHVGEALHGASKGTSLGESRRSVYCIGIATWGIVEHREQLTKISDQAIQYYMTSSLRTAGACLDNNHTHFFLVDNGTVNKYGAEIKFRAQLEKRIMKMEVDKNRSAVPAVLLVLEGGPNTIKTVYEAITQDPAIPVVVIKDSGRAADLLAFSHTISQGEGPLFDMGDVVEHKQLLNKVEQTFPEMDQSKCLEVYGDVLKCVQKKQWITIFKMEEGSSDIDEAILTALLKSNSASPEDQLKLALIWNRADIARSKIFKDDLKWSVPSLELLMKEALDKDRTDFVELLLEHGVNLTNFLTIDRLESLYSVRSTKGKSMMKYLLGEEKCKSGAIRLCDVREIFTKLTCLRSATYDNKASSVISSFIRHRNNQTPPFETPFNELFIWAVLNNMQKMALFLWKSGDEAMAKALVACKLYFAMALYAERRDLKDDIVESLKANGTEFQKLAVQLLDQCFLIDEKRSNKLLTYELTNWGCSTCMTLAVSSEHEIFVAHSCCQELLNDMWAGAMTFRTYQSLKTIFCIFCPPMLLRLGFRSKHELRDMPQTEEQHEEYEKEDEEEEEEKEEEEKFLESNQNNPVNVSFSPAGSRSLHSESQMSLAVGASQKDTYTLRSQDIGYDSLKWWQKVFAFYSAPITKFWGNVLSYLVFLGIFTYVVLGKVTTKLQNEEIVLIVFVVSLTTEEIRQFLQSDSSRLYKKFQEWGQSKWNICDGIAIVLFYVGLGLRLSSSTMIAGHVVWAIDIMLWIIRLLDIFSVNQHLGPYVVMIGRMVKDLLYFLFIMAVFLSAYGVARQALLDPVSPTSWRSVVEIFFTPYWQTYGELFINKDNLFSKTRTYFDTTKYNQYSEPIVSVLMALYMLVANILLLNLLIAVFNNTYSEVQTNSNKIWKFQRYHLIFEYSRRPVLVPPFVMINHVISLCKHIYRKCKQKQCCRGGTDILHHGKDKKMKFFPKPNELSDLLQFEEECLAEFLRKRDGLYMTSKEERIRLILERVDNIWQIEEGKKEQEEERKKAEKKIKSLENKIEALSDNLLRFLNRVNQEPGMMDAHVQSGDFRGQKLPPKRFLSHAPYTRLPSYAKNEAVKKAAVNFRKTSLRDGRPLNHEVAVSETQNENQHDFNLPDVRESVGTSMPHQSQGNGRGPGNGRSRSLSYQGGVSTTGQPEMHEANHHVEPIVVKHHPYYPMSHVERFPVPEESINWLNDYPTYEPVEYTSPTMLVSSWADPEGTEGIQFNSIDDGVDRRSVYGDYEVVDGKPRSPFGRTGLTGRGLLPRWGPNHALQAVITRWKRDPSGKKFARAEGLYSMEFLALQRGENQLAIPSGIISTKEQPPTFVTQIFGLDDIGRYSHVYAAAKEFFSHGSKIGESYEDERNSDNAWIELTIINYHDEEGDITKKLKLNDAKFVWREVNQETVARIENQDILFEVARSRNAYLDA